MSPGRFREVKDETKKPAMRGEKKAVSGNVVGDIETLKGQRASGDRCVFL